jgi:signal recognition particle subunit SEC65
MNNFESSHNYLNYFPLHNIDKVLGSLNLKAKVYRRQIKPRKKTVQTNKEKDTVTKIKKRKSSIILCKQNDNNK